MCATKKWWGIFYNTKFKNTHGIIGAPGDQTGSVTATHHPLPVHRFFSETYTLKGKVIDNQIFSYNEFYNLKYLVSSKIPKSLRLRLEESNHFEALRLKAQWRKLFGEEGIMCAYDYEQKCFVRFEGTFEAGLRGSHKLGFIPDYSLEASLRSQEVFTEFVLTLPNTDFKVLMDQKALLDDNLSEFVEILNEINNAAGN